MISYKLAQLTRSVKAIERLIRNDEDKYVFQNQVRQDNTEVRFKNVKKKQTESTGTKFIKPTLQANVHVSVLADSHGKGLCPILKSLGVENILGIIKPNATLSAILDTDVSNTINTQKTEAINQIKVIIAGANDIYHNNANTYLKYLKRYLIKHSNERIIVYTFPTRYDLPKWSIINKEISKVNGIIKGLKSKGKYFQVIDIENIGRRFHTTHGLHLNHLGKRYMCERLVAEINDMCKDLGNLAEQKIPLMWKKQENQGN